MRYWLRWILIPPLFLLCFMASAQKDSSEISDLFAMPFDDLLNQTVVTASKYEQPANNAPSSVTVVTAEDIKNFGYNSLAELINSQRGYFISYDRVYAYVGNRGFLRNSDYNDRDLLLINGHTQRKFLRVSSYGIGALPQYGLYRPY
jgi:outer membrane receptor for ferrienterochelin and colicin